MINELTKNIEKSLITFLDKAKKRYALDIVDPILYKSIREYSLRGGKRIRPLLFLIGYLGYRKGNKKIPSDIYTASLSIELLHDFMLVHDDIIDNSALRRGKPSMHKILSKINRNVSSDKIGTDLAIVAGDIIYALAFDPLININTTPSRKQKILNCFITTTIATAMGEFIDTIHGEDKISNVKEKDAFLNYTLKTSQYTFAGPLMMGSALAGANNDETKKLSEFGTLAGQSFQIQDDIIGIFGSEKKIGKSILSDLAESKKTLLVCHAYAHLKSKRKSEFVRIFNKKRKSFKDLAMVRNLMIDGGSLEYCLKQIQKRSHKSLQILANLRMKKAQKQAITQVIFNLFNQSNAIAEEYGQQTKISIPL